MTIPDRHSPRHEPFGWAEPLICEQVLQTYSHGVTPQRELDAVVALHTRMWLSLIDGDVAGFDVRRSELARLAQDARLTSATIHQADRAVLLELSLVVASRFRNCGRLRLGYVERLHSALKVIRTNPSYTVH